MVRMFRIINTNLFSVRKSMFLWMVEHVMGVLGFVYIDLFTAR